MKEAKAKSKAKLAYPQILETNINNWAVWATKNQYNLAIYRKPNESPTLLIDSGALQKVEVPIEELSNGFLWANYEGDLWHMEATHQIKFDNNELINVPTEDLASGDWNYYTSSKEQSSTSKSEYLAAVKKGLKTILSSDLVKIVPSKVKIKPLKEGFSLANAFVNLCQAYPTAFVSIVSTKEFGTWLTATPEVLIQVDNKGEFHTMALAGTQPFKATKPMHEVAWTDKDIEEQAMVSRYIINRFKEIRLREFIEKGPMTVRAANLTHLCTTFTVDTKATEFQNLGGVMLNLLHPTSAVCGMPKESAIKLLKEIELHDRKFYTGYLGPVNINNEISLYVNLRCMELFKNKANLFAGAGVTAFSNPEKEWKETELKLNTLLNIIE